MAYRRRYRRGGRLRRRRGFKAMMRRRIPRASVPSKYLSIHNDTNTNPELTRTLNVVDLTNIGRGGDPNRRENDSVVITGIRFRWIIHNNTVFEIGEDAGSRNYYFNIAVVAPRGRNDVDAAGALNGGAGGNAEEFFTSYHFNTAKATSWNSTNNTSSGGGRADNFQRSAPINRQQYAVLWHHRRLIPTSKGGQGYGAGWGNSVPRMDRYVKLNVPITWWQEGTTTSVNQRLILVYWFNDPTSTVPTSSDPTTYQKGAPSTIRDTVVYFRDVRK